MSEEYLNKAGLGKYTTQLVAKLKTILALKNEIIKNITGLEDVSISDVADKQTLVYNAQSEKWENVNPKDSVADLTDTNIASLNDGQMLVYDSTSGKWVNRNQRVPLTAAQIQAILDGVSVYTVSFYNGSQLVGTAGTLSGGNVEYPGTTPINPDGGLFVGWASTPGQSAGEENILNNIVANKSVYAAFVPSNYNAE